MNQETVLIIEDNVEIQAVLRQAVLRSIAGRVLAATDGEESNCGA